MASYKTEGIILKKTNFGEADQIVTFFSKHYGKTKAIAKGVRKLTSRKGGNLELANWCKVFLAEGKSFDIISEVELLSSFEKIKTDLDQASRIYLILELVDKLTPEKEAHRQVFDLLLSALKTFSQAESKGQTGIDLFLASFKIKLLTILGFLSLGELKKRFSLSQENLNRLEKLKVLNLETTIRLKSQKEIVDSLQNILDIYISWVAETKLKSPKFIKEVEKLN